jgi:hypothetical protein
MFYFGESELRSGLARPKLPGALPQKPCLAKKVRHHSQSRSVLFLAENASPVSLMSLPAEHLNTLPSWHSLLVPQRPFLSLLHGPTFLSLLRGGGEEVQSAGDRASLGVMDMREMRD